MIQDFLQLYNQNNIIALLTLPLDKPSRLRMQKIKELDLNACVGQENVFLSPNTFSFRFDKTEKKWSINKNRNHLQTLECLYVDLDLKDSDYVGQDPATIYQYIKTHYFDSELPAPTMAVSSGNGIHMYWKIKSLPSWKHINRFLAMQDYIAETLSDFGADLLVSKDVTHVLRMPGTRNKKIKQDFLGRPVEYETHCSELEYSGIVYDLFNLTNKYTTKTFYDSSFKTKIGDKLARGVTQNTDKILVDFINKFEKIPDLDFDPKIGHDTYYFKEVRKKQNNNYPKNKKKSNLIHFTGGLHQIYENRIHDLTTLLTKFNNVGRREYIFWLMRYYYLENGVPDEEAIIHMKQINASMNNPLPEKELTSNTKSAIKYHNGNKLNWTNEKLIEVLAINKSEIRVMKTIIDSEERHRRSRLRDKKRYMDGLIRDGKLTKQQIINDRRAAVYKLYTDGLSVCDICLKLGSTKSTIYADIQAINTKEFIPAKNVKHDTQDAHKNENNHPGDQTETRAVKGFQAIPENSVPIIITFLPFSTLPLPVAVSFDFSDDHTNFERDIGS